MSNGLVSRDDLFTIWTLNIVFRFFVLGSGLACSIIYALNLLLSYKLFLPSQHFCTGSHCLRTLLFTFGIDVKNLLPARRCAWLWGITDSPTCRSLCIASNSPIGSRRRHCTQKKLAVLKANHLLRYSTRKAHVLATVCNK